MRKFTDTLGIKRFSVWSQHFYHHRAFCNVISHRRSLHTNVIAGCLINDTTRRELTMDMIDSESLGYPSIGSHTWHTNCKSLNGSHSDHSSHIQQIIGSNLWAQLGSQCSLCTSQLVEFVAYHYTRSGITELKITLGWFPNDFPKWLEGPPDC